jgi:hypothetical protein
MNLAGMVTPKQPLPSGWTAPLSVDRVMLRF